MDRRAFLAGTTVAAAWPKLALADENPIRILSIDGGGTRGIAAASIATRIDAELRSRSNVDARSYFDLFAGTSTGSIVAAALAGTSMSPQDIVNIYRTDGPLIFADPDVRAFAARIRSNPADWSGPKYLSDRLAKVLRSKLGDVKFGDLKKGLVIPFYSMGTSDGQNPGAVVASGGLSLTPVAQEFSKMLVREAVLASSSAPLYFDPSAVSGGLYNGVDGGIFANNPSAQALSIARQVYGLDRKYQVVSIGCGRKPLRYSRLATWGLAEWASPIHGLPLLEAVFDSQSTAISMTMARERGVDFYRFDFDNSADSTGMDDASASHLNELVGAANAYMATEEFKATLRRFIGSRPAQQ